MLWETEGLQQVNDFMVFPLMGCDLVLGVQWLRDLGPIIWDFKALTMQFSLHNQQCILHGIKVGGIQLASRKQAAKMGNSARSTCTLLLTSMVQTEHEIQASNNEQMPLELQQLLSCFSQLFEVPTELPPTRTHDHRILLIDETKTVKLRPYRYLSIQKDKIERMVAEMKTTGVIRDSTSSFASSVVLVKKKYGSWHLCIDYRQLNKLTIKDKFPIPLVDELLDELSGACFFSKLDLRSGYHQIRMAEEDIHKTA